MGAFEKRFVGGAAKTLLPIAGAGAGAAAGFVAGGPLGAVAGAQAGRQVGDAYAGFINRDIIRLKKDQPAGVAAVGEPRAVAAPTGAIDRRLAELDEDPVFQLTQAKASLGKLPKAQQAEFGPTIDEALAAAKQRRKQGAIV